MKTTEQAANEKYPKFTISISIGKTDEYNVNEIQIIKQSAFIASAEFMETKYKEKLRWIPIEEKLPMQNIDYKRFSIDVFVKSELFDELPTVGYYDFETCLWCFYDRTIRVSEWRNIEIE